MAKLIEGAKYKVKSNDDIHHFYEIGDTIVLEKVLSSGNAGQFVRKDGRSQNVSFSDVKLKKPKIGDTVMLYRLKHTNKDDASLGYYPSEGMMRKGDKGEVIQLDTVDDSVQVQFGVHTHWYYRKDLAVMKEL